MWTAIGLVTGSFSLVAFIAATAYWAYRRSLLGTEALVKSVPEAERARVLEDFFQSVRVDTSDLTKEQRFLLARELIASRAKATLQKAAVIAFLGLIAGSVAIIALAHKETPAPKPQDPSIPPTSSTMPTSQAPLRQLLLTGYVHSAATAEPLEGAIIEATSDTGSEQTSTDAYGHYAFLFKTPKPEMIVHVEAQSGGYRSASETLSLQSATSQWDPTLRSISTDRLSKLLGRWQATSRDALIEMRSTLDLTQSSPTELRGKLVVVVTRGAESLPGQIGPPSGPPPSCQAEAPATLGLADGDLFLQVEGTRQDFQSEDDSPCDMSLSGGRLKVRQLSADKMSVDVPPGNPPLLFERVGG
jgi:hypothetical protein